VYAQANLSNCAEKPVFDNSLILKSTTKVLFNSPNCFESIKKSEKAFL